MRYREWRRPLIIVNERVFKREKNKDARLCSTRNDAQRKCQYGGGGFFFFFGYSYKTRSSGLPVAHTERPPSWDGCSAGWIWETIEKSRKKKNESRRKKLKPKNKIRDDNHHYLRKRGEMPPTTTPVITVVHKTRGKHGQSMAEQISLRWKRRAPEINNE